MIRLAKRADLPQLVHMGRAFWDQAPNSEAIPYDPQSIHDVMHNVIKDHYMAVSVHGTTLTGFLGLMMVPVMINTAYTQAVELFFYVRPEYRGKGIGKELHAAAEVALRDQVDLIAFGDMSTASDMDKYYKSQGFTQTERTYTKVL